jgi:alkylated DNA repair dioxygenase AlkB
MKMFQVNEKDGSRSIFYYIPNFITSSEAMDVYNHFESMNDFQNNYNYNKNFIIRKQKWFQKDRRYFCEEWKDRFDRWRAFSYTPKLTSFQEMIINRLKELQLEQIGITIPNINSCLVNMYKDGSNRIRHHRDADKAFGKDPTIIGISLGATRVIEFKRVVYNGCNKQLSKKDKETQYMNFNMKLESGSLFIMAGSSQKYWTHGISPNLDILDTRYSITMREQIY